MYILIKRVGRYAPKLGRSLEEILKETTMVPEVGTTANIYQSFISQYILNFDDIGNYVFEF